ncbi:TRAP transporter small permease [Rhizobium oryziradicis]|uniref:TRAP transporter small permease protein n=1 Tax=Rhizobium oryziradicis TaxID=1867956 RepID=A0A1Q8ZKA2_9HYPH|nr:TRAP transporter small permease subunit [Rhizobium oryziradicis]OLP42326.1 C4-dicarboxylate ABC transporter permease [Rhizobium oryziradicis]
MGAIFHWLRKGAEAISALMMFGLFATFLLQIYSRYVMDAPFGWTLELCLIFWLWMVFFGGAFIVRERDHIRFDILYMAVPRGPRRVMALISALAIAAAFLWSLEPTWGWIDFLKIKKSATLRVPMRDIYSIYAIFLVAVIAAQLWRIVTLFKHGVEDEASASTAGADQ